MVVRTNLIALAGIDPSGIARRAGHSSVAFSYVRYGHLFPEADTMAAAKLDQIRIPRARAEVGLAGAAGVGLCQPDASDARIDP